MCRAVTALFISYGKDDRKIALEVHQRLRAEGYGALFLDFHPDEGFQPGGPWERELYVQLRKADGVVFLASTTSVESQWCFAELTHARALRHPIIPLRVEAGAWLDLLHDAQWVDLVDGKVAFDQLVAGLRRAGLDPAGSF